MAPNNGLASKKPKTKSGTTTILNAGTVESRGMGTKMNSRKVISDQIQEFINGEGRFGPKAEFRAFFTVWTFVTRLPGPTWVDHHPGYLMRGMAYFPFSGTLIGSFVSVFFDLAVATMKLPLIVASVISEAASLWITGCFHEDGLADSSDGIGGGWSRDQILKIMTDTRLGTYGCAILLLYIIAKLELIAILGVSVWALGNCSGGGPAIIITHTLARLTAPLLIRTNDYVDEQGPKYMFYSFFVEAKHLVTWYRVLFAIFSSFLVGSLAYGTEKAAILVFCVFISSFFSGRYAEYLLGGVMGDYLGATICCTEVFLLTALALLPHMEDHVGFLFEVKDLLSTYLDGNLTFESFIDEISSDDRKLALFKFAVVGMFTTIWCSCVGHPPVFVRKSVVAKEDSDEIQISLANKKDENNVSPLEAALLDENLDFASRYEAARNYLDTLAKPVGSLGTLEDWAARLATLQRSSSPTVSNVACLIFAGDHGVAKDKSEGGANCSAYPQAVTQKVLEALEYSMAGASVIAATNDVRLRVIDVGLAMHTGDTFGPGNVVLVSEHKVNGGTKNFCTGAAMSKSEVQNCIVAGREETRRYINEVQANVIIFGEVGIGNTTASSALIAAVTGEPIDTLCGSGATTTRDGIDDGIVTKKINIVRDAVSHHGAFKMIGDATLALENVGGSEIAAIVGGMIEASEKNIPILVDGFIVTTAALMACHISADVCKVLLFATKSSEIGQRVAISTIKEIARENNIPMLSEPAFDMNLRMGEGTGALMAVPILRSAAGIISELATLGTVMQLKLEDKTAVC